MGTISNFTINCYRGSGTLTSSGSGSATSDISLGRAENDARVKAIEDADSKVSYPTFGTGSSSYGTVRFGQQLTSISSATTTKITSSGTIIEETGSQSGGARITYWADATTTNNSTRTNYGYQVSLKFSCSETSSNIKAATLTFKGTCNSSSTGTYQISPLKSSSVSYSSFQKYNTGSIVDWSSKVSFDASGTSEKTYSITITDIFKKSIDRKNSGTCTLVIYFPTAQPYSTRYVNEVNNFSISYTLNTSKCDAPTSITFTSIVKPGGSLTISWSGAKAGTNNSITSYDVYYKIGSAPTTSSYDGTASVSSTSTSASKTFTISNTATRGAVFYAMVRTKGSAGSSYYSDWKNGNGGKVNSLPGKPTVTVDKTRIKSTESTTVTFTVTAGSDTNTSQPRTVWYNTDGKSWSGSSCLQVPSNGKLSVTLNASSLNNSITYYFRTWDGIEYCDGNTSQTIIKNTPPKIGSITMSAYNNTTYTPSVDERSYVKNINGTASNVTGTNLTYQWKLCVGSDASTTSYGTITNISTSTSLTNIDVTKYGAKFNTAYKLRLIVTDDLGESYSKDSTNVFVIPAAPTGALYNQNGNSNVSDAPVDYFNKKLRVKFNSRITGVTAVLQWADRGTTNWSNLTPSDGDGPGAENAQNRYYDYNITNSNITYGKTYIFRIHYTCGNAESNPSSFTRTKIIDFTPTINNIGTITYSSTSMTISFNKYPISFGGTYNVYFNNNKIYTKAIPSDHPNDSITDTINISSLRNNTNTPCWRTIVSSGSYAPISQYTITLKIEVTDPFDETLSGTKNFTADFRNSILNINNCTFKAQIKTGETQWDDIPNDYTTNTRYTIFPNQTLRFTNNGLTLIKSYSNNPMTITWYKGTSLIKSNSISNPTFDSNEGIYKFEYTSSNYTIPAPTSNGNITYTIYYYQNENIKGQYEYKIFKTLLCNVNNFSFSNITLDETETSGNYKITFNRSGGISGGNLQSAAYSFCVSSSTNGTYYLFNNVITGNDTSFENKDLIGTDSTNPITENDNNNLFYLGCSITITNNFILVNGHTPTGAKTVSNTNTNYYKNIFTYYKITPNLLYGKNFFVLNNRAPKNKSDELLSIFPTKTRTKIYLGDNNYEGVLELTNNGVIIDCGTWDP